MSLSERIRTSLASVLSAENARRTFLRFPLSIVLFTVLAAMTIVLIVQDKNANDVVNTLLFYLPTAGLMDMALRLWLEESVAKSKKLRWGIYAAFHLLWVANALWLYHKLDVKSYSDIDYIIGNAACVFCMVLAVLMGGSWNNSSDNQFFNFAKNVVVEACKACIVGQLAFLGVSLLFLMLKVLLGVELKYTAYASCYVVVAWMALMLFFSRLPQGEKKHVGTVTSHRFLLGLARYVVNPLLCAYVVVLYVYLLKIVGAWSLPQGGVVWFVTALVVGLVLALVLSFPHRSASADGLLQKEAGAADTPKLATETRWDRFTAIWIPILTLPLVVLMSVAIGRRLSDYGVTVPRLYVLAFNLWCYFAVGYMVVTRGLRLRKLVGSLAAVVLLTSVGSQNLTNIASLILERQLKAIVEKSESKPQLPMNEGVLIEWLDGMDKKDAANFCDKLLYLEGIDKQAYGELVGTELKEWKIDNYISSGNYELQVVDVDDDVNIEFCRHSAIVIPEGFHRMERATFSYDGPVVLPKELSSVYLVRDDREKNQEVGFRVSYGEVEQLRKLSNEQVRARQPIRKEISDSAVFLIDELRFRWGQELNLPKKDTVLTVSASASGYLFTR